LLTENEVISYNLFSSSFVKCVVIMCKVLSPPSPYLPDSSPKLEPDIKTLATEASSRNLSQVDLNEIFILYSVQIFVQRTWFGKEYSSLALLT